MADGSSPSTDRPRRARASGAAHRDFRLLFLGQARLARRRRGVRHGARRGGRSPRRGRRRSGSCSPASRSRCSTTVLVGGALADRFSRRLMMIVSDVIRFAPSAGSRWSTRAGTLTVGLIAVFAIVVGLGDGLFYPAFGGMVPLVVDQPMIASANSLIGLARWGSILLGPALAGLLYAPAGSATVFAVDAASFLVSAALVWQTRPRASIRRGRGEGTLRGIVGGCALRRERAVALGDDRALRARADAAVRAAAGAAAEARRGAVAPRRRRVRAATTLLGVGTVARARSHSASCNRARRRGVRLLRALRRSTACRSSAFALSPWYELAGVLAVVRGVCIGFAIGIWETMLMELVPDQLLSRVVSLDYFGSFGLMPLGLALSALVSGVAPAGRADRVRGGDLGRADRAAADAAVAARDRLDRAAERVAGGRLAVLVAAREPAAPLLGRAVRPGLRVRPGPASAPGCGRRRSPPRRRGPG